MRTLVSTKEHTAMAMEGGESVVVNPSSSMDLLGSNEVISN